MVHNSKVNLMRELVLGARELISDQKRWTTGAYARNCQGESVDELDTSAVCFCAMGAIRKTAGLDPKRTDAADQLIFLFRGIKSKPLYVVNDQHGLEAVLKLFDTWLAANPEKQI